MTELIVYLLESSGLLALLYALYLALMRKETLFAVNRFFLLGILAISLLAPLLSYQWMPETARFVQKSVQDLGDARWAYYEALDNWVSTSTVRAVSSEPTSMGPSSTYSTHGIIHLVLFVIYLLGTILLLARLVWTCTWILRLRQRHPMTHIDAVPVVLIPASVSPFSFLGTMYAHDKLVDTEEFPHILEHERIHIRQRHSIDLILVQVLGAFWWFNPAIWLIVKSLKQTHEYIADEHIINRGYSLVEYQTLLLRQLISNNSLGLIHHFNLSFIKKRITMMKNTRSGWAGKLRVALALLTAVALGGLIMQCNSSLDQQEALAIDTQGSQDAVEVSLPVLVDNGLVARYNPQDVVDLTIRYDQIYLNGQRLLLGEVGAAIEASQLSEQGAVILRVDRNQAMGLLREVQTVLRAIDRRKVLYEGVSAEEKSIQLPMLLPPAPNSEMALPTIDDAFLADHNMEVMKVNLGEVEGEELRSTVYQFVNLQRELGKNYVISAKFDDDDTYGSYLTNLLDMNNAFNQIYDERAREMFSKSWAEISNADRHADEEVNEQYRAVRKGIPRAISIAEAD